MSAAAVYRPRDLGDALAWLASAPAGARCLAGGTDLMVAGHVGAPLPAQLLDIWKLDELRGISEEGEALWVGALSTYTELMSDARVRERLPLLCEAARSVGAAAIQNRGTLGGNIGNASPAGDTLPVLLAHEAEIELASQRGRRLVPAGAFFLGYKKLEMKADELISRVKIPVRKANERHAFVKVGQRRAQAISKVVLAARAEIEGGVIAWARLSLGSVAPVPLRLHRTEAALVGQRPDEALLARAAEAARAEVTPISDVRSTAEYRRAVSGNLAARFVRQLL